VLLDLLLPERCVVCKASSEQLCDGCRSSLPRLQPPLCERCGAPSAWPVRRCRECTGRRLAFATARAAVVYEDEVRELVLAWKERGLRRLARAAANVTAETLAARPLPLVPVPPDRDRTLRRGYHPVAALAAELGRLWGVPVEDVLRRQAGPRQRGLPLSARRANVRGAFTAPSAPRRLVLVDDVYTSGATVGAAASTLRRAGAREIHVVTFARAVRGYYARRCA